MDKLGSGPIPSLPEFFSLVELESVGSTNDEARIRADTGAPAGTIVWAKRQVSGRGRRGRAWISPKGNLYCSVILRPNVNPSVAAQLSFVTALALGEGLHSLLPLCATLQYKWPNDVLIDGKKIAGILLESQVGEYGNMEWVVIGTGVNVTSYPMDTERPATSLDQVGCQLAVEDVLAAYGNTLWTWLSCWNNAGFDPIRKAWLNRAIGIGEAIEVRLPNQILKGTFDSLDMNGALILLTSEGRQHISAGEVFLPN
jgi:BirA family biotin operon repressor/biotin-[acetyl-CoA-carboxylase] ligase